MKSDGLFGMLSSPTGWILAGGTALIAYQIWKEIERTKRKFDPAVDKAADLSKSVLGIPAGLLAGSNPRIVERAGVSPAQEDYLTASIGTPRRAEFSDFFDQQIPVTVNNPDAPQVFELKVKVRYVPVLPGLGEKNVETGGTVQMPTGRKTFDVYVGMPAVQIAYNAYAQAFVNGKMAGSHRFFQPE